MSLQGQNMGANASILPDVQAHFLDALDAADPVYDEVISSVMDEVPMDARQDRYMYTENHANPRRWAEGESIPRGTMTQKSYVMPVTNWGLKVQYSLWDLLDEKVKTIPSEMKKLAIRYKLLRTRVFAQILEGTTDKALLETVGTAVDGATLYSATNGKGGARNGITGGNIVTTADSDTSSSIYSAIWDIDTRFRQFYHPDGINLLLDPEELTEYVIFYHPTKNRFFREAFHQETRGEVVVTDIAAAAVDNLLAKMGNVKFTLVAFNYLTDADDWYVFAKNCRVKSVLKGLKTEMQDQMYTAANSEQAGDNAYEAYNTWERWGCRPHFNFPTIKANVA